MSREGRGFQGRCEANMAHIRQSKPDSGLGFQVKILAKNEVPSSVGGGGGRVGGSGFRACGSGVGG